jgi:hypothetical protein
LSAKPELVTVGSGLNNEGIEEAFHRVLEGATWKRQRVVVVMPAARDIPTKVALSHWSLMFPPNQPVFRMLALGQEVGDAYCNSIEAVIAHEELSTWEYVLTIEHDNIPPPDGLLKLIKRMDQHPEFACIGGLYWCKGWGGAPQLWGDVSDPVLNFRPVPPKPGELVEVNGTGMGFNLWRMDLFKDQKLRKPWFKTVAGAEGIGTQDLYFWADAKKHGYRCAVDCDVLVGHYDSKTEICW